MKHNMVKQSGASILEFLIVMPVIILLAYVAIEFGATFVRANTITKSVQDAARYLSDVHDVTDDAAAVTAKDNIAKNLILYASVTNTGDPVLPGTFDAPTISHNFGTNNDHVKVSVLYHHTPLAGQAVSNLLQLVTGDQIELSIDIPASSVMRYAQ